MKKKTFKQEVKSFYKRTQNELLEMGKYWDRKPDSWHDSIQGDTYLVKIEVVRELFDNLETSIIDLGIVIK